MRELPQDELSDDEIVALHSPTCTEASDLEICQMADLGDPVADEIFYSWPTERQRAASQAADKRDQEQWD
ncbi:MULTISPECIES: hypothetical protein [unclassified Streptomyces]|uniref:hypothetical protein n=1 Tax=unclassified Streptomyces TaxID=2593676 RepID=UPI00225A1A0B|nr:MULTISPECIES: hypothetical protein [unclassified Streptomyces]MCX5103410.1 hypothetical protein [Streptomyces sp. NBC_00439]WSC32376.1 hypothetical protein OG902_39965 [Streptomyces sp. NBC_01768]WSX06427.1 hypothetical protein OG355_41640 [Streptomyces sp. NBC_00987]